MTGQEATGAIVAVRGTGSIGLRHLYVLRDHLQVPAVAIPVRPGRGTELQAQGFSVMKEVEELAGYSSVRSIVATDTYRHLSDASDLLRFGDVLVEKPLAPSLEGLAEFRRTAAKSEHRVFTGFYLRHHAGLQCLRDYLPEVGMVHSVRIECQSFLPDWRPDRDYRQSYSARASEGGVLRDLAHELDYAVWLFGRPGAVWCVKSNTGRLGIASEEAADLMWQVPGGAAVSMRLDYLTRVPRRKVTACGEHGMVEWDAEGGRVTVHRVGETLRVIPVRRDRDAVLAAQAEAFVSAHSDRTKNRSATLEDGAFIVALTDAAHAAARSQQWQRVAQWTA